MDKSEIKEVFSKLASLDTNVISIKDTLEKLPCTEHGEKISKIGIKIEKSKLVTVGIVFSIIASVGASITAVVAVLKMSAAIAGIK